MIERGRLRLKTERGVRPRVSTGIVCYNKIDRQMSRTVETADSNAKGTSRETRVTVSKLVHSAVLV